MEEQKKTKKGGGCYLTTALGSLIIIGIVMTFWPGTIPFRFFEFWKFDFNLGDALKTSWPLLIWAIGINIVNVIRTHNHPKLNQHAEILLVGGALISTWAGVVEEICFRWLIFYAQIVGYKVSNFLFFGWAGFGLPEWVFNHFSGPVGNFLTLGYLQPYLFGGLGWAVGAAILSSNGQFRDGHLYQGFFGWLNS